MTPKPRDQDPARWINPPEKMIFLGLKVWQELRILARLARGTDVADLTLATVSQAPEQRGSRRAVRFGGSKTT